MQHSTGSGRVEAIEKGSSDKPSTSGHQDAHVNRLLGSLEFEREA